MSEKTVGEEEPIAVPDKSVDELFNEIDNLKPWAYFKPTWSFYDGDVIVVTRKSKEDEEGKLTIHIFDFKKSVEPVVYLSRSGSVSSISPDRLKVLLAGVVQAHARLPWYDPDNIKPPEGWGKRLLPCTVKSGPYKSYRGILLLAQEADTFKRPIVTLENYCKWYSVEILHPDGTVTSADSSDLYAIAERLGYTLLGDHNFHPRVLNEYAKQIGGVLDPRAEECAGGRWVNEILDGELPGFPTFHIPYNGKDE